MGWRSQRSIGVDAAQDEGDDEHRCRADRGARGDALEAMRSKGARPMWLPSAWGAKQMPRLPHGVVVRARIIDFLERGYFINEAARWLRELDVELTHEQGGNRPLQGPNGCGIAAGGACGVLAAAGPHWSAIWNANVSFAASCSVSVPSSGSNRRARSMRPTWGEYSMQCARRQMASLSTLVISSGAR